jgi:heme/copper-type cytochrome/quinol oxidase subunit 1
MLAVAIILFIVAFVTAGKWYGLRRRYFIYENVEHLKASNIYAALCIISSLAGIVCFLVYYY